MGKIGMEPKQQPMSTSFAVDDRDSEENKLSPSGREGLEHRENEQLARDINVFRESFESNLASSPGESGVKLRKKSALSKSLADRPSAPLDVPEMMFVKIFLNHITQVSDTEETFVADFWLNIAWFDERLGHLKSDKELHAMDLADIWTPEVYYPDAVEPAEHSFATGDFGIKAYRLLKAPSGDILPGFMQLYDKITVKLTSPMHIAAFPFDVQKFRIQVEMGKGYQVDVGRIMGTQESCYKCFPEEVAELLSHSLNLPMQNPRGRSTKAREKNIMRLTGPKMQDIGEWALRDANVSNERGAVYTFDNSCWGNVTYEFTMARRYGYFLSKFLPVTLVSLAFAFVSMVVDPLEFGDRISLLLTVLLAMVAFSFVQLSALPKRPTLTIWDLYINFCYAVLLLLTMEATVVKLYLNGADDEEIQYVEDWELKIVVLPMVGISAIFLLVLVWLTHYRRAHNE